MTIYTDYTFNILISEYVKNIKSRYACKKMVLKSNFVSFFSIQNH